MFTIKNRIYLALIISAIIISAIFFVSMPTAENSYAGSEEFPTEINDNQGFLDFIVYANSNDTTGVFFTLNADLYFEGGAYLDPVLDFKGNFDGQGYMIRGIIIDDEDSGTPSGIFSVNNGIVSNLFVKGAMFVSTTFSGSIAGINNGIIDNCSFDGSHIFGQMNNGGIAGKNAGEIRNSYANAFIFFPLNGGGIVGENLGLIENCFNIGSTNGKQAAGGIAAISSGEIRNCYNAGEVSIYASQDNVYVGGIVGLLQEGGKINNCYNVGNISANNDYDVYAGAILGMVEYESYVENCYFDSGMIVQENSNNNKGGWYQDEFSNIVAFNQCQPLTGREMSGGENLISFTDISLWIFLADNLDDGKVYYPQLSSMYFNQRSEIVEASLISATKEYDVCTITLYDDYENFISEYKVYSGEQILPPIDSRIGFITKGWSATVGGSIINPAAKIVHDTTVYAVYEFEMMSYSLNNHSTVYGGDVIYAVTASHLAPHTSIEYQWYKMEGSVPVLLEGETNSVIILKDCENSGFYQARVTATNGKYSVNTYDTKRVIIAPFSFERIIPVFTKTYGTIDANLIQQYTVEIAGVEEIVEVVFVREQGEGAGSYDILSASSQSPNFIINLIGESQDKYIINKADYTYSFSFTSEVFVYDGNEHMLDYDSVLPEGLEVFITMTGNGISAGEHYISAAFIGDFDNYNGIDPVEETMYIQKANYNMDDVTYNSIGVVYNGQVHNIYTAGTLPAGVQANFSVANVRNSGEYPVNITFTGDFDNYNTISERHETITILPKGLQPIFDLPANMIEDGVDKEITITAEGIIEDDEVEFTLVCSQPLIYAGTYYISATINNSNYVLYNENAMIQIYAAYILSDDTDNNAKISSPEGLNGDYVFIAEIVELSQDLSQRIGSNLQMEAYDLALMIEDTQIQPFSTVTIEIALTSNFTNVEGINLLFYNDATNTFEEIDFQILNGIIVFNTNILGTYIITSNSSALPPQENEPIKNNNWLKYSLYGVLAVILLLIIILAILIANNKKQYNLAKKKPIMTLPEPRKSLLTPLTDKERTRLQNRMKSGKFVDWELNRDLKLYAIWSENRIEK